MPTSASNRTPTGADDVPFDDEAHRDAFNAAFHELELSWYWDADTYRTLLAQASGVEGCARVYIDTVQPHMLKAYDAEFLIEAINGLMNRYYERIIADSGVHMLRTNWAEMQRPQIGI